MKMKTYIDPPHGHRYGFPKVLPDNVRGMEAVTKWLVEQGYPQEIIDEFPDGLPCGIWQITEND